ncbi:sialic acid TRAP transporter substrate-binding protein SiaP [Comamonadaceae bacterium G21597-S1]|nr:sialic acid TRAP transporter substrate-binding protein SiaP [Comamonadaceae bacterium G21597-S1]
METTLSRRSVVAAAAAASLTAFAGSSFAQEKVKLRLSSPSSATDQRAVALTSVFAPAVADFATFEPHWNAALFKQGTELEAISRGNLDMSIASAQELAEFFPEFSIFSAGYLHKDAAHQKRVFESDLFKPFKKMVEDKLGVKLLTVMYLGRRQLNLRTDKKINTPEDLAGIKLRMPGSEAWMFLGRALGANPTPMAFTEVYTGLQTGAIDGQDNPLPTNRDAKFFEVTKQIVLTSHLVDLNYLTISKKVFDKLSPANQARLQKAADDAAESGRQKQLKLEDELVQFFKDKGLQVYTPNVDAFRARVQKAYLESDLSKSWPKGLVEKINAL